MAGPFNGNHGHNLRGVVGRWCTISKISKSWQGQAVLAWVHHARKWRARVYQRDTGDNEMGKKISKEDGGKRRSGGVRDKKGLARAQQLTRCRRRRRVGDAYQLQLPNQLCNSSCLRSTHPHWGFATGSYSTPAFSLPRFLTSGY